MPTDSELDFEALGALAGKAQQGDAQAYADLLRQLYPFVRRVIRFRLGAVVAADDVTQECLLGIHKSLQTYHPSRPLKAWVNAIVRYKVADHFRALSRKSEQMLIENIHGVTNDIPATNSEDEGHGEAVDVEALLNTLPAPLRRAVTLTKLQGVAGAEAAAREGISETALRKRVSRAYKRLAKAARREMET